MALVDIIIPIHNRLEHTKQTLESLFKNTDPTKYNLYLIDDGSTEEIKDYLHELGASNQFTLERKYNFSLRSRVDAAGPAVSRNIQCMAITNNGNRSKYLYHSDNDVYFKEGWLEKLITIYELVQGYKSVLVLGGGCHPYLQSNDKYGGYLSDERFDIGFKDAVSGYSQLMTWETWDKYGPFETGQASQEKKIMGSEDWAFCQKIIKDGFFVGSLEPEVVIHTGKTNTYGEAATGVETFKEIEGVKII